MRVAWQLGTVNVRQMLDALSDEQPLAYTTVMTIMSRLATKGLLERTLEGKTYVYQPTRSPEEFLADLSRQRVDDVVAEFGDLAIAQFLQTMSEVSPGHLARLRQLLSETEATDE
jgi:predicted transcriptional regulator